MGIVETDWTDGTGPTDAGAELPTNEKIDGLFLKRHAEPVSLDAVDVC